MGSLNGRQRSKAIVEGAQPRVSQPSEEPSSRGTPRSHVRRHISTTLGLGGRAPSLAGPGQQLPSAGVAPAGADASPLTIHLSVSLKALVPDLTPESAAQLIRITQRLTTFSKYVRYWRLRPDVSVSESPATWWQHAGRAVLQHCRCGPAAGTQRPARSVPAHPHSRVHVLPRALAGSVTHSGEALLRWPVQGQTLALPLHAGSATRCKG